MMLLRSYAFVLWMYGLMTVMGIVCLPTLLMPRKVPLAAMAIWRRLVLWGLRMLCGITFEVRGRENMPAGGALVAMKHQSMFETIIAWELIPDPAIILKRELMFLPVFGWYAWKLRNIVVDRAGHSAALRKMLADARRRVKENRQVVIFPEGTRLKPGEHIPYKPGVAALYGALEAPCVPVALNSGLYWPAHGVLRRPGRIVFDIGAPIQPGLSRQEFMATLEERIETASNALLPDVSSARDGGAPARADASC
ncbi:MAG: lysophospholipid acyltransferase family protein [Maricaulaceae bacterium]|jgi:1-acyl-sn-glycerol-3-phosphate acyltransferase